MTTLQALGLAYRKAKVNLYYSSYASLDAIADYEEAIHSNLTGLLAKLQGDDESWVTQPEFIGGCTLTANTATAASAHQQKTIGGVMYRGSRAV